MMLSLSILFCFFDIMFLYMFCFQQISMHLLSNTTAHSTRATLAREFSNSHHIPLNSYVYILFIFFFHTKYFLSSDFSSFINSLNQHFIPLCGTTLTINILSFCRLFQQIGRTLSLLYSLLSISSVI